MYGAAYIPHSKNRKKLTASIAKEQESSSFDIGSRAAAAESQKPSRIYRIDIWVMTYIYGPRVTECNEIAHTRRIDNNLAKFH